MDASIYAQQDDKTVARESIGLSVLCDELGHPACAAIARRLRECNDAGKVGR